MWGGLKNHSPEARAKSLANLRPGKKGSRHKHLAVEDIPGLAGLIERTTHKELVAFCRANVPAAMKRVAEIIRGDGYKVDHVLEAIDILLNRAFGRAPMLVHVADDASTPRVERSAADQQIFAKEVLTTLIECGVVVLPDGATIKRNRDETIVEDAPRAVDVEIVDAASVPSRAELLRAANVTPVERSPESPKPAPTYLRADSPIEEHVRMILSNIMGFDCDPAKYAQVRNKLVRHASKFPDEAGDVERALRVLDARFGA